MPRCRLESVFVARYLLDMRPTCADVARQRVVRADLCHVTPTSFTRCRSVKGTGQSVASYAMCRPAPAGANLALRHHARVVAGRPFTWDLPPTQLAAATRQRYPTIC